MDVYQADGLYAWTVTLDTGEQRTVLAATVPTGFASPVTSAQRGEAYAPGPPPTIASLVPASAPIGAPNFTLRVHGTGFRAGDVILWNGLPEPTTLVSPTEVTTLVNMATATTPIAIPVAVRALTGGESNAATFTLTPPA